MRISIVANQIEKFTSRVVELSKKFKKDIAWFPSEFRKVNHLIDGDSIDILMVDIDVEVEQFFSVDGFQFYALVKDCNGVPSVFGHGKAFQYVNVDKVFKCPECSKSIPNRTNKIFLKSINTGEIVAYGSSCADKVFGSSYKFLAKGIDKIQELKKEFTNSIAYDDAVNSALKHDRIVSASVMSFLSGEKYVTRKAWEYDGGSRPTADVVVDAVWQWDLFSQSQKYLELKEKIEIEKAKVHEFYSKEFEPKENFDFNVKTQFVNQGTTPGMIAYGVYKYFWEMEKRAKALLPQKPVVDSIFSVGDKVSNLELIYKRQHLFNSDFGQITFYNFEDKSGAEFVIKVGGHLDCDDEKDLVPGQVCSVIKATVKDKKFYKGIPQTVLKLSRKNHVTVK